MSRNHRKGRPPPYYAGHPTVVPTPGPSTPGAIAYVPAQVMMPVYTQPAPDQGQPTYITNHIYQQPQPPAPKPVKVVKVVKDYVDWVPATPSTISSLTHRAVVAGNEGWDGSPLWVIRAHHGGDLVPGKLAAKHRAAYVPYSGQEVPVHNFEVLCAPRHTIRWVSASNGRVPVGAIPAGNTHNGEPLYVGRVGIMRSLTPGKIHPSHGCLYISFQGNETSHKQYEVLCKIVG